jgi:hypothetical protein
LATQSSTEFLIPPRPPQYLIGRGDNSADRIAGGFSYAASLLSIPLNQNGGAVFELVFNIRDRIAPSSVVVALQIRNRTPDDQAVRFLVRNNQSKM